MDNEGNKNRDNEYQIYGTGLFNPQMSLARKVWWRLKFLLFEAWGKDWSVVKLSLSSAKNRGAAGLTEFLARQGIIKLNKKEKYFQYKDFIFFYDEDNEINSCLPDFVSIWSSYDFYFKKNFINNSAYIFEGPYEIDEVKLEEGDFIIDAGANIGLFSILASQRVGETGQVFAFEPIREAQEILKKNIVFNQIDNINIIPEALGSNNSVIEFVKLETLGQSSGFVRGNFPKEKVKQVTLDYFVKKNRVKKVDFIKADIEGMEREMIKGAEQTIKKFKPKISICIYHRADDLKVLRSLIKGFVPVYNFKQTKTKLYAWVKN